MCTGNHSCLHDPYTTRWKTFRTEVHEQEAAPGRFCSSGWVSLSHEVGVRVAVCQHKCVLSRFT